MIPLSIIIVSYNNQALLKQCLQSIYSSPATVEVIIVDNHSQDNTISFLQDAFPQVRLIANDHNQGFAKANNQGLKIAQGKNLLLLNNDTIIRDQALSKMVDYLESHSDVGLLGPKLLNRDGSVQIQGSLLGPHFWNAKQPVKTSFLRGAALLFPRTVLDKVGLLDEGFFFYNEDIDFCWRVKKAGYKVVYYPEAEIIHYGGKTSWRRQLMGLQGTLYLWWKWLFLSR